jgi:hypothetical protein
MIWVVMRWTLSQGFGLEALKGQLLIIPNVLTSLHLFMATLDNTQSFVEGFKGMVAHTIILKTSPNRLLWPTKFKLHLNPFRLQGSDISQLLEESYLVEPLMA